MTPPPRLWAPLRNRNFALLWAGQTLSRMGNFIYDVALGYAVYVITGSALKVGVVLAAFTVVQLSCLLFAGVVGDRRSRRRIVLVTDIVGAVVTSALALLIWRAQPGLIGLCAVSGVLGALAAFHLPAYRALLPQVVSESELGPANALFGVTNSVTRIVGPVAGAGIVALCGAAGAFTADAVTFVVAAALMFVTHAEAMPQRPRRALFAEVADGVRFVARTRWLRDLVVFWAAATVLAAPATVLLPIIIRNGQLPGATVGIVLAAVGVGSVAANLRLAGAGKWTTETGPRVIFLLATGLGAGSLLLGATPLLGVLALAGVLLGIGNSASTAYQTLMQSQVPSDFRSRVGSLDMVASFGLLPPTYALAGVLADRIGPGPVVVAAGLMQLAVCAGLLVAHRDGLAGSASEVVAPGP